MKTPTLGQTIVLLILWSILSGFIGNPMVAGAGSALIWIWFLYGWVTDAQGFAWQNLTHPEALYHDIVGTPQAQ
jgi:hypothetical protein